VAGIAAELNAAGFRTSLDGLWSVLGAQRLVRGLKLDAEAASIRDAWFSPPRIRS
jgi:hypothetical protein